MKTITIKPQNVCSREFIIEYDDNGVITSAKNIGGCSGNLQGICSLIKGRNIEDVIKSLEGIKCPGSRNRDTSCPDQLAQGLKELLK